MNADEREKTQEPGAKKRIVLVVDGRPSRQFYTSIFLQRLHYHVIMAKTAEDALIFFEITIPLVVITDIDLPGMDGLELLRWVKQKERTRKVPVIMYSKRSDPETREACRQAGCADFVVHPCSLDQLYAAVQHATEERPRSHVRHLTSLDVTVGEGRSEGGEARDERITDISEVGMFISTGRPLSYGSVLPFAFFLPNAPGWVVRVEGEVRFVQDGRDPGKQQGMGVKFLKIGDREQELVRDYVKGHLMEGIAGDRGDENEGTTGGR